MKISEKQGNIARIALAAVFAGLTLLGEVGLIRYLSIANLTGIIVCWVAVIAFCALFSAVVFGKKGAAISKKKSIISGTAYAVLFLAQVLLLVGYRQFDAAVIVSSVLLLTAPAISFLLGKRLTMVYATAATLIFVLALSLSLYYAPAKKLSDRIKNTPITKVSADEDFFGHGIQAKKIFTAPIDELDKEEIMLANSLQGILSITSEEQLLYKSKIEIKEGEDPGKMPESEKVFNERVDVINKYYPEVEFVHCGSFGAALEILGAKIDKYILYDASDLESLVTAANLCNTFGAVMLTKDQLGIAQRFGWERVFDATCKNEKWLIKSDYFGNISKTFMFLMKHDSFHVSLMYDYAIAHGYWMVINDMTERELEKKLSYMNRNCVVLGGLGNLSENGMVNIVASYGGTFVFASSTNNLSTLSGFRLENAAVTGSLTENGIKKNIEVRNFKENPVENKHTVCIMLSDGDNMRFSSEQCLVDRRFYGSDSRSGDLPMSIGVSGAMIDIAPIILLSYYDKMFPNEDFVLQISSLGYTYPSKWKDKEAWEQVITRLARIMSVADIGVVEIMDDISFMGISDFPYMFDSLGKYFDTYTARDEIDGCLFIDFMNLYAGFKGEIYWSNGKPVVSARYCIWNDESPFHTKMNEIENIADAINKAPTDVHREDAYTFVIVHSWSGVDENGNLIKDGDAIAAMAKLKSLLDEDVDVVTATEFIARLKEYVEPKN